MLNTEQKKQQSFQLENPIGPATIQQTSQNTNPFNHNMGMNNKLRLDLACIRLGRLVGILFEGPSE